MNEKRRGILEMSAAMGISGTIGWVVLHSNQAVISLVFWRCLFGAIALFIACVALRVFPGNLTRRVMTFAALGGVAIVANWLLLFAAFPLASISITTAVYSTQPFILVGLGAAFLGERITATKLLWLAVSFGGALLIIQAPPSADYAGGDYLIGIAMAFGAAFCYALASLFAKKLLGTPPHLIALIQVCVGVLMLAPFARVSAVPADANAWGSLVALGVIYTGLVFTLQYGAIQRLPTFLIGSLYFVYPSVAIVVDVLAFDHRLRATEVMGIGAILVGAAGMNLGWSVRAAHP
jgi:drug/metabolite transporter (DMT)-like permease